MWWAAALHTKTSPCNEAQRFLLTSTSLGAYLRCSPSRILKPDCIGIFLLLRRVSMLIFFQGCIQPCYNSAHCCLPDSRWGWESKASDVLVGAGLVQQGSAIFRQFSGCLYTARKGWVGFDDAKKEGTQYLPGTLKLDFGSYSFHTEAVAVFAAGLIWQLEKKRSWLFLEPLGFFALSAFFL